jgi:hypothetical protein
VIDTLKGGALLFAYYPDRKWLNESPMLRCGETRSADAQGSNLARVTPSG